MWETPTHPSHCAFLFTIPGPEEGHERLYFDPSIFIIYIFFSPYLGGSAFLPTKSAGKGVFDMLPDQAPPGAGYQTSYWRPQHYVGSSFEPLAVSRAFKKEQSVSLFSEFGTLIPTAVGF